MVQVLLAACNTVMTVVADSDEQSATNVGIIQKLLHYLQSAEVCSVHIAAYVAFGSWHHCHDS